MMNGLYIAASGLFSQSRTIDVISNNIANLQTAGFKEDAVISGSFGEQLAYRLEPGKTAEEIGYINSGDEVKQISTLFSQGSIEQTGGKFDFAIEGNGFFTLQKPDGTICLTRNGRFLPDENGYLTSVQGDMVLGKNGPVQVSGGSFDVNEKGQVYINGNNTDELKITYPPDLKTLVKQKDGTFIDNDTAKQVFGSGGEIVQGALEASNVDMITEMTNIIASSRSFQACSQLIRTMDQILQKSANEVGKL